VKSDENGGRSGKGGEERAKERPRGRDRHIEFVRDSLRSRRRERDLEFVRPTVRDRDLEFVRRALATADRLAVRRGHTLGCLLSLFQQQLCQISLLRVQPGVCVCVRARVCVCVCVCRERERGRERERERERSFLCPAWSGGHKKVLHIRSSCFICNEA